MAGVRTGVKDTITVRQLLSHQAGLPVIDPPLTMQQFKDPTKISAALAAQAPAWISGTRHGYHAVTLGWYESELIRHADPSGRSLGQFFAEEIAKPLGLEFYIGLPASVDRNRVAHLHGWSRAEMLLPPQRNAVTDGGGGVQSAQPRGASSRRRPWDGCRR